MFQTTNQIMSLWAKIEWVRHTSTISYHYPVIGCAILETWQSAGKRTRINGIAAWNISNLEPAMVSTGGWI